MFIGSHYGVIAREMGSHFKSRQFESPRRRFIFLWSINIGPSKLLDRWQHQLVFISFLLLYPSPLPPSLQKRMKIYSCIFCVIFNFFKLLEKIYLTVFIKIREEKIVCKNFKSRGGSLIT